jgi:hypothetical protein
MTRDEEYQKVFGVKPKKPRKPKPVAPTKTTGKGKKQADPNPAAALEEPTTWNFVNKQSIAANPKDKKNIRFLLGLVIVFVALLLISLIMRLFQ